MPDPNNFILPEHRTVFMLTPKAANTSVKYSLLTALGLRPTYPGLNTEINKAIRSGAVIRQASKHEISAMDWLKVGFVRNPYTRFISFYKDKVVKGHNSNKLRSLGITRGMSIEELLDVIDLIPDRDADQHFRSQAFDLVYKGRIVPDIIVYYEELEHGWSLVQNACRELSGLTLPALPILNKTAGNGFDLSSRARSRLFTRYHEDFEWFDYEP